MNKIELLAPVGNIESLYQAVANGADAVYLGGKKYGARSYANNFYNEELISAIKYCHLYGVKIYVTVNTVIFDKEIDEFLQYIEFLYKNNVDAVIMQDIGMIRRVREMFPSLEIHASTQMHNHNKEGIKLLEELGVKRVVFARELSIEEIKSIDTNLDTEVFVHGAICVCYSGCCLFSAMTTTRSGNRGECVASCRLPYELLKNDEKIDLKDKYLLSPKELNTISHIDKLISSNITSLKIEGRMKSPEYVGFITKIYREAIDSYYAGEKFVLDNETLNKMKCLYNREFTKGYLFGDSGKALMNIKTPNHQGIEIGNIIDLNKKQIKINLKEDLNQEDGIRFAIENKGMIVNKLYNEKGLLVNSVKAGCNAIIDNKVGISKKQAISKTIDKLLIDELSKYTEKKIPISIKVIAKKMMPLKLIINDMDNNLVEVDGVVVESSINKPLDYENIRKQITKLGNTCFCCENIDIEMDEDIFISIKDLNETRRFATDKLKEIRETKKVDNDEVSLVLKNKRIDKESFNINVLVRNEEQLKACLNAEVDNIYITDFNLYKNNKNKNVYYVLPRVVSNYKNLENENLLIREIGSITKYKNDNKLIGDYTLNATNEQTIKTFNDLGLSRICVSPEVDIESIMVNNRNAEIVVYGRIELMITKYCMLNTILNSDDKKCSLCRENNKYSLKDEKNRIYPIYSENCLTTIYDYKNIDLSSDISLIKNKFNNIRINLLDEDYNKSIDIINKFKRLI